MHQAKSSDYNCFITLTYSDENLPKDDSLDLRDLQLFWKKLRKRGRKFKYLACGEYGSLSLRPHYHAALFGVDFHEDRELVTHNAIHRTWISNELQETWDKGYTLIGDLTVASASYIAKYIMKKSVFHGPKSERYKRLEPLTGEVWSVKPEFVVMSKRPGLGAEWFEKWGKTDVYPSDLILLDGRKFRPPRYYDKQLSEDELEELQARRGKHMQKMKEDLTPERLRARERGALRKIEKRKL